MSQIGRNNVLFHFGQLVYECIQTFTTFFSVRKPLCPNTPNSTNAKMWFLVLYLIY